MGIQKCWATILISSSPKSTVSPDGNTALLGAKTSGAKEYKIVGISSKNLASITLDFIE